MTVVITTVGISLLSNYIKYTEDNHVLNLPSISEEFNKLDKGVNPASNYSNRSYSTDIEHIQYIVTKHWLEKEASSAELQSTLQYIRQSGKDYTNFKVVLIATDTVLSRLAAELICIRMNDISPELCQFEPEYGKGIIEGVVVHESDEIKTPKGASFFDHGFMNLINRVAELITVHKKDELDVALNISGGYKAIVPVITLIGQIKEVPLLYNYETSDQLVEIGNLPFSFDQSLGELYFDFLTPNELKEIDNTPEVLASLKNLKLIHPEKNKLTILGQLFHQYMNPVSDSKKSFLGYFIELKAYEFFQNTQEYTQVDRSTTYWWNLADQSKYTLSPQFDKDPTKEYPIEVDLILGKVSGEQIWVEVKACSNKGLNKAIQQIGKRLEFIDATEIESVKAFWLLLYKLPRVPIEKWREKFRQIQQLFNHSPVSFEALFFDLPINNNNGTVNPKALSERKLEIKKIIQ